MENAAFSFPIITTQEAAMQGKVEICGVNTSRLHVLSQVEMDALLRRAQAGDEDAREKLIEGNLRLVLSVIQRFDKRGENPDDLFQVGCIGLIKAISTYRLDKKIKLATYASRCIENEILMYIRKTANQKTEVSLDEPINMDCDGNELLLCDILGTESDYVYKSIEENEDKRMILRAISGLCLRDRKIIELRYGIGRGGQEMTQKEVADMLGISQSYISRLEKKIIARMKEYLIKQNY